MACTRFRSARCTPASSSRATSASQVVGEKVLRLEERLGYMHKGIEKRVRSDDDRRRRPPRGPRVAATRTVAYAWAYAQAVRSARRQERRRLARLWLRALALERERVANHLGDLGSLGNDARLRVRPLAVLATEGGRCCGSTHAAFGHRYGDGLHRAGRRGRDLDAQQAPRSPRRVQGADGELATLRAIFDEHAGLQDRFIAPAASSRRELASRLGLIGLAGRASGQAFDLRCEFPAAPYDTLDVRMATRSAAATSPRAWPCASTS